MLSTMLRICQNIKIKNNWENKLQKGEIKFDISSQLEVRYFLHNVWNFQPNL